MNDCKPLHKLHSVLIFCILHHSAADPILQLKIGHSYNDILFVQQLTLVLIESAFFQVQMFR
jgi:hypothetical protein